MIIKILFLKKLILILILIFLGCSKDKTNSKNTSQVSDSLSIYLDNAHNFELPLKEREANNYKALNLLQDFPNDTLTRKNYMRVAIRFFNMGLYEEYKASCEMAKNLSLKANDTLNLARALSYLGDYYKDTSKSDSAFLYYNQAEKEYLKLNNNLRVGEMYLKKAETQYYNRDYRGAENTAYIAMKFLRLSKDSYLEYQATNLIGLCLNELKDYETAIQFHNKALAIVERNDIPEYYQRKASSLNNLGLVYKNIDNYPLAIKNFSLALKEPYLKADDPFLYAMAVDNLAHSKLKYKDFNELPDLFYESLQIRDSLKATTGIIMNKIHLSEYYEAIGTKDSSLKFAQDAHRLALESRSLGHQLLTLKQLGNVETEKSNLYTKQYIDLSDSLLQEERKVSEKFARIEFETDEFKRQKEQLAIQNRNIILFALLAVFIVVLLYIIRDQRNRNAQFRLREAQQRANEEIYNLMLSQQKRLDEVIQKEKQRIGQELHDGVLGRLFGARLNLDSLNRKNDDKAIEGRDHYISELKNIEQDIREISHELNREKFALVNNFVAIITNLLEEQRNIKEELNLIYKIDPSIKWDRIANDVKINLYRIVQESLQNINKYAAAKNVSINLLKDADNLHLSIIDDGVGFDVSKKSKGIGLKNIESRVQACKGIFEIKSKKGAGTRIIVDIPITK